jgi:cytidine deaminase
MSFPDSALTEKLVSAAMAARGNAYAPYSRYHVGAALLGEDGRIYPGANVENAAYPQGACAEAGAISHMVLGGARRLVAVAVIGSGPDLCTPCGGCRQRLFEFGTAETPVILCRADGSHVVRTLGDLLPMAFGPSELPAEMQPVIDAYRAPRPDVRQA